MQLNKDEKDVLKYIIKEHLKEIENKAALRDSAPAFFAADVEYDQFLKDLLKKLS